MQDSDCATSDTKKQKQFPFHFAKTKDLPVDDTYWVGVSGTSESGQHSLTSWVCGATWLQFHHLASSKSFLAQRAGSSACSKSLWTKSPISCQLTFFFCQKINQNQLLLFAVNSSGWYNRVWRCRGLWAGSGNGQSVQPMRQLSHTPVMKAGTPAKVAFLKGITNSTPKFCSILNNLPLLRKCCLQDKIDKHS